MCHLVLIEYVSHGHIKVKLSLGKNLSQYLPIGAWLVIALVAWVQSEFEWPNCNSYELSLEYDDLIGCKSSPRRSRKFLPLKLDAWKVIFHCERIESHLDFLQKSQEFLHLWSQLHAFLLSKNKKKKENQKKRNIKSRKIDKRKRKSYYSSIP